MVTKTPLYEDGVLVGIISVSSDAAVVNSIPLGGGKGKWSKDFVNGRTCQSRANDKPGIQRLKRVQWPPRPQIASSVSNLVLTNFIITALDIFVSSLFFSILIEK
jgi:hypothetical protein